jgi:hypothetical protein
MLVIPRAAGQDVTTLEFGIVMNRESFEVAKGLGNPPDPAILARGDVHSAQGAIQVGDERVGTFYPTAVVMFEAQHFATAANHFDLHGYLELFGEGTPAVTGVVRFTGPNTVAITGGTGAYNGASGHCTSTPGQVPEPWVCEVR